MFKKFNKRKITRKNFLKEKLESNIGLNENDINKSKVIELKKSNFLYKLIINIVLIIIFMGVFAYKDYLSFKTNTLISEEVEIKIEKGELPIDIAHRLGLNQKYLKLYLKNNNPEFKLLVGNFKIEKNSNIEQILSALENPIIQGEIDITLLEGWNIYDIDEFLANKGLISEREYINYVTNLEKIGKLTEFFTFIEGLETLEGFLYPDTYKIAIDNFKINTFVIKQLENFENRVYNTIMSDLDNKEIEKLINLASIVEKEEKNINEKSTVAGILKKRLENGWMIGADITVCYPHELTANECKMIISKYINEKSEYNTRTKQGLPKTPIGNPSFETINATQNLKETKYWFYLHDTITGKIYYAITNAEHEQNKRLYLK
ncbi:MAG: endolytic transglycosylase MltG [Candidatus Gracilibacteria bacterium]